jgi:hypothetical protein
VRGLTSTILLVVVLAGLGGYIYFDENKKPAGGADTKAKAFDVTADQIEELQIKVADGDATRIKREDKAWKLVEPVEADGDNSEITNMASSLASLDVQSVVDEAPGDLAQFGLNPPRIEIAFRAKGKKDQMRLLVGDKTPTGGDVYAKKPDEKRVILVSSIVDDTFHRTAFDLRDKTVLKFDRDKVDGLEITRGDTTMQFARKGAEWTIVKPAPMRADYAEIEGLITSMSATLMQKFVSSEATPAELKQYGLDKPATAASILMGGNRTTLLLGKTDNAETYAKVESRPAVVMVAPTIVSDLAKPVSSFRRKDLLDMRSFSTTHLEVMRGTETLVLDRSAGKDGKDVWKNGSGATVDAAKVEDLLTKLSNLRAASFEDKVDPALKMPTLTVTARFGENKGENRTETARIAQSGTSVVASRPDEPGAMKLESANLTDVTKALDALK